MSKSSIPYHIYFHFLTHALLIKVKRSHRVPLTVHIGLTTRCPNRCLYCSYSTVSRSDRITTARLKPLLDEAYQAGTRRVHFTGGEPLLHPGFDEIIDYAAARGFLVSVATSGHRAGEHLQAFRKCHTVLLSLDGPPEIHATLRGELSTKEVYEAAELFTHHGVRFWTTTVLTALNLDSIDWIVDYARRHGTLSNFSLLESGGNNGCDYHPSREQLASLYPSTEKCRAAIAKLITLKKAGAPVGSSLPYLRELLTWPDYRQFRSSEARPGYSCLAGRVWCEISADGMMHACDSMREKGSAVSVLEHGFSKAFRLLPMPKNCSSCLSNCCIEHNLIFNLNPRAIFSRYYR